MLAVEPSPKYVCPHCNKASKIPEPIPKQGKFQLTCAHCKEKTILRFNEYQYEIEQTIPPAPKPETFVLGTETPKSKPKPLFERKVVFEREIRNQNEFNKSKGIWQTLEDLKFFQWRRKANVSLYSKNQYQSPKPKTRTKKTLSIPKFVFTSFVIGFFLFIVLFSYFVAGVLQTKKEIPAYITHLSKNLPTKILDRNGEVVSEIFQKRTSTLKLSDYPEEMISILLNIEDQKFFSHGGVDYSAIFRASLKNVINLSYKQGASTITQQLARIILDDRRKSLNRKWREAQLAFALESYLSKEQILELYMNHVYLGHGAFGFGEGIKFYFQKNPRELTKEEMVLLASLPSAPNKFSPLKNPEGSFQRVGAILVSFRNRGIYPNLEKKQFVSIYHKLSVRSPNETVFGQRQDIAPYVTEHVRYLLSQLEGDKNIYENGGYTIETTLDRGSQEIIGPLVKAYLSKSIKSGKIQKRRIRNQPPSGIEFAIKQKFDDISIVNDLFLGLELTESEKDTSGIQAAIVGIQPNTGQILFLHGGEGFHSNNQFNRVTQMRRQTGSTIKAILYASAFDAGAIHMGTKIMDAPLYYRGGGGKEWSPENLNGSFEGEISLRTALVKSKNTAAVQIAERLGMSNIDHYFTKYFFPNEQEKKSRFRPDLSVALGSLEISPLEMATAFSGFVNQGTVKRPYLIQRIRNARGEVLFESGTYDEFKLKAPMERQVIKPDTAEVMISLLQDSGKASGVRNGNYTGNLIGKTGTTNDYKDAWFVGARPDISLAVWVGYDDPKFGMGPSGLGGAVAAPLWGEILSQIDKNHLTPKIEFPAPTHARSYKICLLSGKEASANCPSKSELYVTDHPPEEKCLEDHKAVPTENKDLMKGLY